MADILRFEARPRSDRAADPVPAGSATILFFTGVRYERLEPVGAKPAGVAKSAKARAKRSPRKRA